jgi:hypothetical protein
VPAHRFLPWCGSKEARSQPWVPQLIEFLVHVPG